MLLLKLIVFFLAVIALFVPLEGKLRHHHKRHHVKNISNQHSIKNITISPQNASRRDSLGFLTTFHKNKAKFNRLFVNKLNETLSDQGSESIVTFFPLTSATNSKKVNKKRGKSNEVQHKNIQLKTIRKNSKHQFAKQTNVDNNEIKKVQHKHLQTQGKSHTKGKQYLKSSKPKNLEKKVAFSTDIKDDDFENNGNIQSNIFELPEGSINIESKHSPILPHFKGSKIKGSKYTSNLGEFNLEGLTKDLDKTIFDTTFSGSGDLDTESSGSKSDKSKKKQRKNLASAHALKKVKAKTLPVDQSQSSISTDQADHARSSAAGTQYPNFPVPPMPIPLFYNSGEEEGSTASGMTDVKPSKDVEGGESGLGETMAPTAKTEGVSGDWVDKILADQNKHFDDDDDDEEDEDEKEEKHARKLNNLAATYTPNDNINNKNKIYNNNIQPQQKTNFFTPNQLLGVPAYPSIQYSYPNVYFQPLTYYQAVAKRLQQQKELMASQLIRSNLRDKTPVENVCSAGCNPLCAPSCDPLCCQGRADVSKFSDKDERIAHEAATEAKSDMLELQSAIKDGKEPVKLAPPPNQNTKISEAKVIPLSNDKNIQIKPQDLHPSLTMQEQKIQQFQQQPQQQQQQIQQQQQQPQQQQQQQQDNMQEFAQIPVIGMFQAPQMFQQNNQMNQQLPSQTPQASFTQPHQQMMQYSQGVPETNIQHMQTQQTQENTNSFAGNYAKEEQSQNHDQSNSKGTEQGGQAVDNDLQAAIQKLPQGNVVPLPDMMIDNGNTGNQMNVAENNNNQNAQMFPQNTLNNNMMNNNMFAGQNNLQQNYGQVNSMSPMMPQTMPGFTGMQTQKDALANGGELPTPSQQNFQSLTTPSQGDTTTTVNPQIMLGPNSDTALQPNQDSLTSPEAKDGVSSKPFSYPNPLITIPSKTANYALKPIQPILLKMESSTSNENRIANAANHYNRCHKACERSCLPFCTNYCCGIGNRRTYISRHKNN